MRDVAQLLIVARLLVVVLVAGWLAGCAGAGGRGRGRGRAGGVLVVVELLPHARG